MKDDRIEPMDPKLVEMLRRGAPRQIVPSGAEARVFAKLASSIASTGGGTGNGAGGTGLAKPTASPVKLASIAVANKVILVSIAVIAIGGGAIFAMSRPVPTHSTPSARPSVPATAVVAGPEPTSTEGALPTLSQERGASIDSLPNARLPSGSGTRPATRSEPPAGTANQLAQERALIEEARSALAAGDPTACLRALETHASRHADGALVEEREALMVRALVAAGQREAAARRAAIFRNEHPGSLLLPAVESALGQRER